MGQGCCLRKQTYLKAGPVRTDSEQVSLVSALLITLHRLIGSDNRKSSSTILESRSPRPRCWWHLFLLRPLFAQGHLLAVSLYSLSFMSIHLSVLKTHLQIVALKVRVQPKNCWWLWEITQSIPHLKHTSSLLQGHFVLHTHLQSLVDPVIPSNNWP